MALANFLLLTILFISSHFPTHGINQNQTLQSMILKSCHKIENRDACISNMQSRIDSSQDRESHDHFSILTAALHNAHDETRLTIDRIGTFNALSITNREQLALADCKELLDFSVSELGWSMSEMNKIRSGFKNPNSDGNLKAGSVAALSNQDTCLEGVRGTGPARRYVRGSLSQVTQLIGNVLTLYTQMHSLPFKPSRNNINSTNKGVFPKWMTDGDKEMLVSSPNGMHVDSVVALDGSGRYRSIGQAIFEAPTVSGKGFIARDITFRNTAGPENHQGVALRVDSDQSAFYRCSMEGYQDTLYAHSLRQFYRECTVSGTIDFIFGNGAAVLQNCKIFTRRPLPLQKVTITAQGRKDPHQSTGFSIQDSYVYATRPTYLGRPWKLYSRTVFINTYMSSMVQPRGWLEWYGDFGLGTLWYGEYRNYGPGAKTSGRVKWPGFHIIRDASTAGFFSVGRFLNGMSWLPATGVKFTAGLTN
ncbi:hypothetical protein DH2020_045138 [Rehmannia glutinosa]|uniref:Pectinesterase n=1 Tax=Rehmannia glutinosa TaxID=99300 RepID=A0ABR0UF54_REHGL